MTELREVRMSALWQSLNVRFWRELDERCRRFGNAAAWTMGRADGVRAMFNCAL